MGAFNNFDKWLYVSGPRDLIPRNALRRATGIHHIKTGSVRSRHGSTQIFSTTNNPHSLFRFNDLRFHGGGAASNNLYRDNASIDSSLDGSRLHFVSMQPTAGVEDYLFVAGGGNLIKIDKLGAVTQWGIAAPADSGGINAATNGAGALEVGAYIYRITFRNTTTGSESNDNGADIEITTTSTNERVQITGVPTSPDSQVNQRRIYRTVVGGSAFFLAGTLDDNTATTFDDNLEDTILSSADSLDTDNDVPPDTVEDAAGPHEGRMWFLDSAVGRRGRVYFSASGRAEAFSDFIVITNDDDPMQRLVIWDGSIWAISQNHVFQIIGTSTPFTWREISGALGTNLPDTVVPSRIGVFYQANEGVQLFRGPLTTSATGGRQFEGQVSNLVGFDAVGVLFQGESREGIQAFEGVVATVGRNQYYISDGTNTLALDLMDGTWRNVGVGVNALFYERDNDEILAAFSNSVMLLEDEGAFTDAGSTITWEIETAGEAPSLTQTSLGQLIVIDMNPNGQTITPTLVHDNDTTAYATFADTKRVRHEIAVNVDARVLGVRLAASLRQQVEVFSIALAEHVGN